MEKPHRRERLYNRDREVRTIGVRVAERIVVPEICVQQNARGGKGAMTKTPITLQELRQRIYRKAKSVPTHRFWGAIYPHYQNYNPSRSISTGEEKQLCSKL